MNSRLPWFLALLLFLPAVTIAAPAEREDRFFKIQLVDRVTKRGVPLVELTTVNDIRYYTDSNGIIAMDEPGLAGNMVFFHIQSHGYQVPRDGFGYQGVRLKIIPGGEAVVPIDRLNIAERLYRITGGGIYRDSLLVGEKVPLAQPLINGRVLGSDSVVHAVYRDRIYWFWGDTNRPRYPLGNFHVPGATSVPPSQGGLDPAEGVNLQYLLDDNGFARPTAKMPGTGPTWIDGLTVVPDRNGQQKMFAHYVKIKPPLTIYRQGLAGFDDVTGTFGHLQDYQDHDSLFPYGHPLQLEVEGIPHVYFGNPLPTIRVRATAEAIQDPGQFEAYNCFSSQSRPDKIVLERDKQGKLVFSWKRNGLRMTDKRIEGQLASGGMQASESPFHLQDAASDKTVRIHSGSVNWNAYRKRWIMIGLETFGSSFLGEVWYAEAQRPEGPWSEATKIVTHDKYSFYNPKHHPVFDQQGGRLVYFEGTYVNTFSGNPDRTPRYNYNQIMYRLDLADERITPGP